jgi:hypothetical protein
MKTRNARLKAEIESHLQMRGPGCGSPQSGREIVAQGERTLRTLGRLAKKTSLRSRRKVFRPIPGDTRLFRPLRGLADWLASILGFRASGRSTQGYNRAPALRAGGFAASTFRYSACELRVPALRPLETTHEMSKLQRGDSSPLCPPLAGRD